MKRCRELDVAIIENSETMTPRYAGMAEGLANERRVIMDGQFSYVDDRQNVTNRGKAGVTVVYVGTVWPLARWRIDAEYGF